MLMPLMYLIGLNPELATTIVSVCFGTILLAILVVNFFGVVVKVYKLKNVRILSRKSEKSMATKEGEILEVTFPLGLDGDEERFDYTQKQIKVWQGALLQIGRESDTSNGSNNSRHSGTHSEIESQSQSSGTIVHGSIATGGQNEGSEGALYKPVATTDV